METAFRFLFRSLPICSQTEIQVLVSPYIIFKWTSILLLLFTGKHLLTPDDDNQVNFHAIILKKGRRVVPGSTNQRLDSTERQRS